MARSTGGGEATVDAAEAWLGKNADGSPMFLWVHLFDPHAPYVPPAPYDTAFTSADASPRARSIDLYDGEIRYTDAQVGRLLAAFVRAAGSQRSLVVVTSDHGEAFWEHGYAGHNRDVHEEEVRVPLVMRWRDAVAPGQRVAQPVQLIDLLPTIVAACGVAVPPAAAGLDLLAALAGAPGLPAERPIYLTRPYFGERGRQRRLGQTGWGLGVRRGAWKLMVAPAEGERDLYDLEHDPDEEVDRADDEHARTAELEALVLGWHQAELDARGDLPLVVPRDVRRRLRALGYVQ